MDSSIFIVNQEPYCIWEIDIRERNKEFLDGIDPGFFDYVVDLHLNADDDKSTGELPAPLQLIVAQIIFFPDCRPPGNPPYK